MKPLEDATIGQRVVTTFIIVLLVILILALIGWLSGDWNEGPEAYILASADESFTPSKYDDRLLALDREAADNAYRDQIEHLFAIWMRDDSGQPGRAVVGARQARKAYIAVMTAIEKREEDVRKLKELRGKP